MAFLVFFHGNCDKYKLLYKKEIKSVFRAALAAGGQIVKMSKYYLSQITGNMALTFRLRIKKELCRHKLSEMLAFNLFK